MKKILFFLILTIFITWKYSTTTTVESEIEAEEINNQAPILKDKNLHTGFKKIIQSENTALRTPASNEGVLKTVSSRTDSAKMSQEDIKLEISNLTREIENDERILEQQKEQSESDFIESIELGIAKKKDRIENLQNTISE